MHGVRDGSDRPKASDREVRVLSGGHALARAAHLHAGLELAVRPAERAARRRRRCCRASPISTRCSMRCSARAKRAARSISTASRCSSSSTSAARSSAIVPVVRNDAHKLIEECMLAANVCTAEFLARHKHPALYRVHEGPDAGEARGAPRFPRELRALALPAATTRRQPTTRQLLLRIKDRPDYALLQTVLLRSLQQARYRPDNVGHFGLSYEAYAHFTSPDPPLSGSRRPSRDQGGAGERRVQALAASSWSRARRALLAHRAPRRRRDPRRRELAQVLLHAGSRSARLRRHDQRRHELRHLRDARRPQHRRARARDRARTRLFPFRRRAPRA